MEKITLKRKVYLILESYENYEDNPYLHLGKKFDVFMLSLIFFNLIAFVLETVDFIYKPWRFEFRMFEYFSVFVFTLEYILRLWCITESKKYKGSIRGRLKYMITPFALIDLFTFLPAYLPLIYSDFRFIRSFRLLRLFRIFKLWRHSGSLRMLTRIIISKKEDLQVIFFTIILIILVAASLMYMLENKYQPQTFSNIPKTMWWAVVTLTTVGYGDIYPVTALGKVLASIIAILGIALFAIPAGIVSAGFMHEIERSNVEISTNNNAKKIEKAFHTTLIKIGGEMPVSRRVIDLITLKSRLQLSEQDVFDAIKKRKGFRVRFKQNTKEDRFSNTLVIEHFDYNRSYGSYIDRDSHIVIVSPMSYAEHAVGHFTAHLARYIQADYVSNEMYGEKNDFNADYAFSFTNNKAFIDENEPNIPEAFKDFKQDIQTVVQKNENVFIIKSSSIKAEDFNFHFGGKTGEIGFDIQDSTFKNIGKLQALAQNLSENFLANDLRYSLTTHKYFDITHKYSLHQYIWKYTQSNVVTIYINNDLMEWTNNETYYKIIEILGNTIIEIFDKNKSMNGV